MSDTLSLITNKNTRPHHGEKLDSFLTDQVRDRKSLARWIKFKPAHIKPIQINNLAYNHR